MNLVQKYVFILLCPCLVVSLPSWAQPVWDDAQPLPKEFDWLKLTSGEWLKGEVRVLYNSELEFDSDKLGLLTLDWDDIAEIRTQQILSVRFNNGSEGVGRVLLREGSISFNGATVESYEASGIMSMAAGEPKEANYWSAKVTVGGNFKRGNTNENILDSSIDVKRRTNASQFRFNYLSTLREIEGIETENSHRINSNYDVYLTQNFYWRPIYAEYYRDELQNISHRSTLGLGVGYHIFDTDRTSWNVTAGPGFQYTRFVSVAEGDNNPEGSALMMFETRWEYELTNDVDINALYNMQITNEASGSYKHHSLLGMDYELTDSLDFNISFIWDMIQDPQRDDEGVLPEQNDTRMTVGIGYEF